MQVIKHPKVEDKRVLYSDNYMEYYDSEEEMVEMFIEENPEVFDHLDGEELYGTAHEWASEQNEFIYEDFTDSLALTSMKTGPVFAKLDFGRYTGRSKGTGVYDSLEKLFHDLSNSYNGMIERTVYIDYLHNEGALVFVFAHHDATDYVQVFKEDMSPITWEHI